MKSATKAYHNELTATFAKVIEHHSNRDFDVQPSVANRLRERLSKRAEKVVELQMAAKDAELEWEAERRQERARRAEKELQMQNKLLEACEEIVQLREEIVQHIEEKLDLARELHAKARIVYNSARIDAIGAEIAANEARERVLWLRGVI